MSIANRVKLIRLNEKMTQTEFAAEMGLGRDVVGNIESDRVEVKRHIIKLICYTYHVNEDWLVNGKGEMYKSDAVVKIIDNAISNENGEKTKEIVKILPLLNKTSIDATLTLLKAIVKN